MAVLILNTHPRAEYPANGMMTITTCSPTALSSAASARQCSAGGCAMAMDGNLRAS
jgi:hypothetical protein